MERLAQEMQNKNQLELPGNQSNKENKQIDTRSK